MKKLLMAAVAATAISSPAFAAPDDTDSFLIGATVQLECSLENPSGVNLGGLSINEAPGNTALLLNAPESDEQRVWASCNYGATTRLITTAGGLRNLTANNDGPDAADFTDTIEYRLALTPSSGTPFQSVSMNTNGLGALGSAAVNQPDAFHDQARLTVTVNPADQSGRRPLAGIYADLAIVSLSPI